MRAETEDRVTSVIGVIVLTPLLVITVPIAIFLWPVWGSALAVLSAAPVIHLWRTVFKGLGAYLDAGWNAVRGIRWHEFYIPRWAKGFFILVVPSIFLARFAHSLDKAIWIVVGLPTSVILAQHWWRRYK